MSHTLDKGNKLKEDAMEFEELMAKAEKKLKQTENIGGDVVVFHGILCALLAIAVAIKNSTKEPDDTLRAV